MSERDEKDISLEQKKGQELVTEQRKLSPVEKATNVLAANEIALKALILTLEGKLPSSEELQVLKGEANIRGLIYRLRQTFPTLTDIRNDLGRTIREQISVSRGELDEKDWERAIRTKQEKYLAAVKEALDSLGEVYDEEGPLPSEKNKERIAKDLEELQAIVSRGQLSEDEARWFSQAIRAAGSQPFDSQKEADFEKLSKIISAVETILPAAREVQGFSPGERFQNTLISIKERHRIGSELRAALEKVRKPAGVIPEVVKLNPDVFGRIAEEQPKVEKPVSQQSIKQKGIKERISAFFRRFT